MRRICLALLLLLFFVLPSCAFEFVTETVDKGSHQGEGTSLAIDNEGNPHVSFIGDNRTSLKYAYYDGSEWQVDSILSNSNLDSKQTCIAIDKDEIAHVVATSNYSDTLFYTISNGSEWEVESFDYYGRFPSITTDEEGYPHIVFIDKGDYSAQSVKYAWFNGTEWIFDTVLSSDDGDNYGNSTSIALDNEGLPHVSFYAGCQNDGWEEGRDLMYAHFDGELWTVESADWEGNVGKNSSIAIDSSGNPRIGYHSYDTHDLKYAVKVEGSWTVETVVSGDTNCSHTSMALDGNDNPHFSFKYGCGEDSRLYYISFNGTEWSDPVQVDPGENTGWYSSIAIDSEGAAHISYYDETNYDAKYASFDGENWTVEAIPPSGPPTGYYPDMVLDSSEHPHLVYSSTVYSGDDDDDDDDDSIFYAFHDGTEWQKQVIVSGENDLIPTSITAQISRGGEMAPSIAMDGNDVPHVIYGNSDYSEISYGVLTGDTWNFETVSSDLGTAFAIERSLGVEENGTPHISFVGSIEQELMDVGSSGTSYSLWYAVKSGDIWDMTSVDQYGNFRTNVIALDSNNIPHIAYYDSNSNTMKYTEPGSTDGSWDIQIISSDIYVETCDLALDHSGIPHIALVKPLYDMEENSLKLVRATNYELIYATFVNDEWLTESVDSIGYFYGGRISIKLDSSNMPHITYGKGSTELRRSDVLDISEKELKYAYYDGSSWHTTVLETGNISNFGLYSSLALDSGNIPHIAYFTGTGLNYMTAPEEAITSGGDGCNLTSFSPFMTLLLLPLIGLIRRKK